MRINTNKFKETILKEFGTIDVAEDLKHQVLMVRDEYKRIRISAQVWWLDKGVWQPGKGYLLTGRQALSLATTMNSLTSGQDSDTPVDVVSRTQMYIVKVRQETQLLSIEKWWRKDTDSEWTFNKTLEIRLSDVPKFAEMLETAGASILNVR